MYCPFQIHKTATLHRKDGIQAATPHLLQLHRDYLTSLPQVKYVKYQSIGPASHLQSSLQQEILRSSHFPIRLITITLQDAPVDLWIINCVIISYRGMLTAECSFKNKLFAHDLLPLTSLQFPVTHQGIRLLSFVFTHFQLPPRHRAPLIRP